MLFLWWVGILHWESLICCHCSTISGSPVYLACPLPTREPVSLNTAVSDNLRKKFLKTFVFTFLNIRSCSMHCLLDANQNFLNLSYNELKSIYMNIKHLTSTDSCVVSKGNSSHLWNLKVTSIFWGK